MCLSRPETVAGHRSRSDMAVVGPPVWGSGVWGDLVWGPNVWPSVGGAPGTGVVWSADNGVVSPPATATQGTQANWMCVNGVWVVPAVRTMRWPRFVRDQ